MLVHDAMEAGPRIPAEVVSASAHSFCVAVVLCVIKAGVGKASAHSICIAATLCIMKAGAGPASGHSAAPCPHLIEAARGRQELRALAQVPLADARGGVSCLWPPAV